MGVYKTRKYRQLETALILLVVLIVVGVFLFPVFWTILTSFKTYKDAISLPPRIFFSPTLNNYKEVVTGATTGIKISYQFFNSLIVALESLALTLVLAILAGYSLARFRFRGKKPIGFFILATRMLPPIGTVIPIFITMHNWNLLDTRLALVLSYSCLNVPLATWILKAFFQGVPRELEESARIDGCSRLSALGRITLPLAVPGIAATAVLSFILAWNDFTFALFLTSRNAQTLPIVVFSYQTELGIEWGAISAAGTVAMIPIILFTIFAQKHLIKGLTMGAVKQ